MPSLHGPLPRGAPSPRGSSAGAAPVPALPRPAREEAPGGPSGGHRARPPPPPPELLPTGHSPTHRGPRPGRRPRRGRARGLPRAQSSSWREWCWRRPRGAARARRSAGWGAPHSARPQGEGHSRPRPASRRGCERPVGQAPGPRASERPRSHAHSSAAPHTPRTHAHAQAHSYARPCPCTRTHSAEKQRSTWHLDACVHAEPPGGGKAVCRVPRQEHAPAGRGVGCRHLEGRTTTSGAGCREGPIVWLTIPPRWPRDTPVPGYPLSPGRAWSTASPKAPETE